MTNTRNFTMSLSIMSGKGGVGKTNLALNLGYALYKSNQKLLLMDCDLGLANLDVLLGMSPDNNLQDLLRPEVDPSQVVQAIEPNGFDFLPAASGVPELVEMDEDMQSLLMEKLTDMISGYDFLVLDLGAGINSTVLSFAAMTHFRVVIITPEPTSLTDSYALMKVLQSNHGVNDFHVVVNQASGEKEAKVTFERLQMACKRFLNINLRSLGYVRTDPAVLESVRRQTPLLKHAPQSNAGKDILSIAIRLDRLRKDNREALQRRPVLKDFPDVK